MTHVLPDQFTTRPHTSIRVARFQPFESRRGLDTVYKLSFPYDPIVIRHLKFLFAKLKPLAVDPAAHRLAAGGWLAREKCWFVEPCVWPAIKAALEADGYRIEEGH